MPDRITGTKMNPRMPIDTPLLIYSVLCIADGKKNAGKVSKLKLPDTQDRIV